MLTLKNSRIKVVNGNDWRKKLPHTSYGLIYFLVIGNQEEKRPCADGCTCLSGHFSLPFRSAWLVGSGRCASPSWVCSTNHPRYRATHKPVPQQRTDSTGNGTHRRKQPLNRLLLKLIRKLFLPLLCGGEPQT